MFTFVLLLLIFLFVTVRSAHAYLDPGTGSYMTQLLIGFLISGTFIFKTYWHKIVEEVKHLLNKSAKNDKKNDKEA